MTFCEYATLMWMPLPSDVSMKGLDSKVCNTILHDNLEAMRPAQKETPWKFLMPELMRFTHFIFPEACL